MILSLRFSAPPTLHSLISVTQWFPPPFHCPSLPFCPHFFLPSWVFVKCSLSSLNWYILNSYLPFSPLHTLTKNHTPGSGRFQKQPYFFLCLYPCPLPYDSATLPVRNISLLLELRPALWLALAKTMQWKISCQFWAYVTGGLERLHCLLGNLATAVRIAWATCCMMGCYRSHSSHPSLQSVNCQICEQDHSKAISPQWPMSWPQTTYEPNHDQPSGVQINKATQFTTDSWTINTVLSHWVLGLVVMQR